MRARWILLPLLIVSIGSSLGCSAFAHWQFGLARRLEDHGRTQTACRVYRAVLGNLPVRDRRWRSQAYYRLGECLLSLGQPEDAVANLQQAVDADGDNSSARLRLGEILLAGGAMERAVEQALAALRSGHDGPETLALLGAASSGAGQNGLAEAAFKKVLEVQPGSLNIALALADIYNREDRMDEARVVLRKAAQARPSSALPLLALGRLEEQEGRVAGAELAYREAVLREDTAQTNLRLAQFLERELRLEEAETVLRRVDYLQPSLPTALADFKLLAGKVSGALEQYQDALEPGALPKSGLNEMGEPAFARPALASRIIEADLEAARASKDPAGGRERARLHLDQYRPELDAATIAALQAEIALAQGDVTEAESQGRNASQLAPQSAASQYVYGLAKYRDGDTAEAQKVWLNALELDGSSVPARLALAGEALRVGDVDGAEAYVLPAVREEPANSWALDLYARVLLAQRRFREASIIAQRGAQVDGNAPAPHVTLGEIAEAQGQEAVALLQFERAVVLDPRSQEGVQGLVRVYRHGTVSTHMLLNLERLAAGSPQSAVLMEIAGRLYARQGRYARAQHCLQQALAIDPQRRSAALVLAQIFAAREDWDAATRTAAQTGGEAAALFSAQKAQQKNDVAEAIAQYETALRRGDPDGVAANNLAWLYAQQGARLNRALALAEKARTLTPADPAVLDTVGVVHLRRREYTDAITVLQTAAALAGQASPNQPKLTTEIRKHLAEACLRAGVAVQ